MAQRGSPLRRPDIAPTGFSRDDIVEKTMQLLVSHWADDLSFAQIAAALGTTSGTLHYFYPNREALLNEVASRAFAGFRAPKSRPPRAWREELLSWLWAIQKYCQQNPVAMRSMAFEGRVSDAWLEVTAPVWRIFRSVGLQDRALAFATTWFLGDAMGQIMGEFAAPAFRRPTGLIPPNSLAAEDKVNLNMLRRHLPELSGHELLEFGFAQLIRGVEALIEQHAGKR